MRTGKRGLKMRIGVVAEPPRISSCTKLLAKQVINFQKRGHEPVIIVQQRNLRPILNFYPELLRVEIKQLAPIPLLSKALSLAWKTFANAKLPGGHAGLDIDFGTLVHGPLSGLWLSDIKCEKLLCQTALTSLIVIGAYAKSRLKKVIYLHDLPMSAMIEGWKVKGMNIIRLYESWVLSKADELASITNSLARIWLEQFGVSSKTIYPGCDPSHTFPYPKEDYILSVTRWSPDRKPFFLIDLIKGLVNTNLKLIVGGSWTDKNTYKQFRNQVLKEKLQNKVRIVLNPSRQTLLDLYRGARCHVCPFKMTLGATAFEAAAQGTPIVYTEDSGVWEVFRPGVHGLAVVEGDIDSYVESVLKFEDNDTVKKIGYSIWKKSHEYSWDSHVAKFEKVLE